jgi:hypothetical protein
MVLPALERRENFQEQTLGKDTAMTIMANGMRDCTVPTLVGMRSLAHRKMSKWQLALEGADLVLGRSQPIKLTITAVAKMLGISPSYVWQAVRFRLEQAARRAAFQRMCNAEPLDRSTNGLESDLGQIVHDLDRPHVA